MWLGLHQFKRAKKRRLQIWPADPFPSRTFKMQTVASELRDIKHFKSFLSKDYKAFLFILLMKRLGEGSSRWEEIIF